MELAFLDSFQSGHRDTLDSPARSLCWDWGDGEALGHGWFWGDGMQSVATVAQMYWFVVQALRLRKPVGSTRGFCLFERRPTCVRVAALTWKSPASEASAAEQTGPTWLIFSITI